MTISYVAFWFKLNNLFKPFLIHLLCLLFDDGCWVVYLTKFNYRTNFLYNIACKIDGSYKIIPLIIIHNSLIHLLNTNNFFYILYYPLMIPTYLKTIPKYLVQYDLNILLNFIQSYQIDQYICPILLTLILQCFYLNWSIYQY